MARIYSAYDIAGNYNNLVVYWVGDQLYSCTKSSLDEKRFRKDRAFKKARQKAKAFGIASQLVKEVYKSLPKAVKRHGLFGQLTGFIHKSLQEGKSKESIVEAIQVYFGMVPKLRPSKRILPRVTKPSATQKQKLYLSNWQVMADGCLQLIPTSWNLHPPLRKGGVVAAILPDG